MPKTVLITGANRGLGFCLSGEFYDAGYNLILHCRGGYDELKKTFPESQCRIVVGDLCLPRVVEELSHLASDPPLDVLVNNAGVYSNVDINDLTIQKVKYVMYVNFLFPIELVGRVWEPLRISNGMIVNINSLASRGGGKGEMIYAASKAALTAFSESLQFDATNAGISILNVNLGGMNTDMTSGRPDRDKFINPEEAARVIVDLSKNYQSLRITSVDIKRRLY